MHHFKSVSAYFAAIGIEYVSDAGDLFICQIEADLGSGLIAMETKAVVYFIDLEIS